MELKNFFAQTKNGPVIPNPTVYLYQPGTTTLATGLQDKDGAPLNNPFTGTTDGFIQFAAPDGEYSLRVTGSGRDFTMRVRFISVDGDKVAQAAASATAAIAQASLAEQSRQLAETARDAAFVNAVVYASTAAAQADGALGAGQQYQVVDPDGLTITRYRKDSGAASTMLATYPSAQGVDAADGELLRLLSGSLLTLLDDQTPPALTRGVHTLGNVNTLAAVYGWRSPFKANGKPFNVVQMTVRASAPGTMRVAVFSATKQLLAWGDCEVGTALSNVTVLLNKTVRSLGSGDVAYIGYFDPTYTRLSSYPGAGAYDASDADATAHPEQYVTNGGNWVNGVSPGNYRIHFRAFDLVSTPRQVGQELTDALSNASAGASFQRFASEDKSVVSASGVSVQIAATAPGTIPRDITYCGWGQVCTPAGVPFNAIRIPSISQTVTTEASRWKELHVFVRVGDTPLAAGTVVARGSVRINKGIAGQSAVVVLLKDPATGQPKTLSDADLGTAYMVAVHAINDQGARAACGTPTGTLSNSTAVSGYCITSNPADVEAAAFGATGGTRLAFEHLLLTTPEEALSYDLTPAFLAAISSAEPAPELVLPPTLHALQGLEAGLYFDNILLDDATRYEWKLSTAVASGTMRQYNERFHWVPAGAVAAGSMTVEVIGKTSGITLSTATINLRAAASDAGAGSNKNVILVGDSLINAGVIGQTMLDLAGPDPMDLTLYGTRGAGLNRHEGRPGWRITQYTTEYTDGNGPNPFWVGGAVNVPQYLVNNAIPVPDWVVVALGINDCFGQTTDAGVVALASSSFNALDGLVTSMKACGAGVRVALVIPSPPSADQDSFGLSESMVQTRARFKRNILIWGRELIARYAGQEASRIHLVSSNLALDTRNNMSRAAASPINARSTVTVARQNNGVHPAIEGYQQIGDALWSFLKFSA